MRPRRGTELHGRRLFLALIVLGSISVVSNLMRIATETLDTVGLMSTVGLVVVGGYGVWRGGYMLEWWGSPEQQ